MTNLPKCRDERTLMERWFGVNWRTSLSGIGTAVMSLLAGLAALPYQLGDVAMVIPPEWKPTLFKLSAVAAFVLKIINSMEVKDRKVSGTPATGLIVGTPNAEPRIIRNPDETP